MYESWLRSTQPCICPEVPIPHNSMHFLYKYIYIVCIFIYIYFMTDKLGSSFLIAWIPSQFIFILWGRHFELSSISPFYMTLASSGSLQFTIFTVLKLSYTFHPHYICISVQTVFLYYIFNVMYDICRRMCATHNQLWYLTMYIPRKPPPPRER